MATIHERKNKNGSTHYRVWIRRKNCPLLCLTFSTKEEAQKWTVLNEQNYIENPQKYQNWVLRERLNMQRNREFIYKNKKN